LCWRPPHEHIVGARKHVLGQNLDADIPVQVVGQGSKKSSGEPLGRPESGLGLTLDVMQGNETSATGVAIPGVDQQSLLQMVTEVLADVEVNIHGKFS
jgi:hypothetical protein